MTKKWESWNGLFNGERQHRLDATRGLCSVACMYVTYVDIFMFALKVRRRDLACAVQNGVASCHQRDQDERQQDNRIASCSESFLGLSVYAVGSDIGRERQPELEEGLGIEKRQDKLTGPRFLPKGQSVSTTAH